MKATRIQLLNGQRIETATLEGVSRKTWRVWGIDDMDRFPQAEKGLGADEALIVEKATGEAWTVSVRDALAAGLPVDTIEVEDGVHLRTSAV